MTYSSNGQHGQTISSTDAYPTGPAGRRRRAVAKDALWQCLQKTSFSLPFPPAARDLLTRRAVPVALPIKTKLYEAGRHSTHVYFLTSGLASMVAAMVDGGIAEVGMFGREAAVGSVQVLGPAVPPTECFMQIEGSGLRLAFADFRQGFNASEEIRTAVLRRVQVDTMVLGQIAGCHRLHEAEERLARWLLTARDRVEYDTLDLTQEFLAEMLGARRATVTMVAGAMQRSGLIEYHRGRVRIVNRPLLELAACDCYRIVRDLTGSLEVQRQTQ